MHAATDFPGVKEGDMSIRICSESTDPLVGGPRRSRTAEAFRITAEAGSRNVLASGSEGVDSVWMDREYNPDRSEDPWGKAKA